MHNFVEINCPSTPSLDPPLIQTQHNLRIVSVIFAEYLTNYLILD